MMKFYQDLEIDRSASAEDIKRAYKKQAIKHHPDKGGDQEKFKAIAEAYQVLSDPEKRRVYDQIGDDGWAQHAGGGGGGGGFGGPFGGVDPFSFFEHMFHGHGGRGPRREEVQVFEHVIRISLAEAYKGITKNIKITFADPCSACKVVCGACGGRGFKETMIQTGFMMQVTTQQCNPCNGTGTSAKGCGECKQTGKVQKELQYHIEIPAGVHHGTRHSMEAEKHRIVFHIQVVNGAGAGAEFSRNGNELIYTVQLTPFEALVGKKIQIPHFDGPIVLDTRDHGVVASGQSITIHGKGMPVPDHGHLKGNLIVNVVIRPHQGKLRDALVDKLRDLFAEEKLI